MATTPMTASTGHVHAPLKGIACAAPAMSLFPVQDAIVKWLSADYSIFQLLFLRTASSCSFPSPCWSRAVAAPVSLRE